MSSISAGMNIAASAMNVHSRGMAVTAHNLANVNTAGFEPQRAAYATGPQGRGVQLDAVFQGSGLAGAVEGQDARGPTDSASLRGAALGLLPEAVQPSGTDLAREMTQMIATQRTYEANARVMRSGDAMLGTLLDMKA